MKIVKLDIDENSILAGIDAVALVEQPAIEEDFLYFSKQEFETYNDYPKAAVEAAKRGIELNEENDNKCATQVGKVRAQQLVNGENLSLDTIRRMRAFLIRQRDNYELARERKDYNACGYISYLLWGGEAALPWSEKKLRQAGEEFSVEDTIAEELIKTELAKDTKYVDLLPEDVQEALLDTLESVGISEDEMLDMGFVEIEEEAFNRQLFAQIITSPNKPSVADFGDLAVRYKYTVGSGEPIIPSSRKFCVQLVKANLVFRKEDINSLSLKGANNEFGLYDIFAYKGNFNCRHYWKEVYYKRNSDIADAKRPLANSNRILDGTTVNSKGVGVIPNADVTQTTAFSAVNDKQILVGPLMKPNQLIKRMDDNGDEYYVYFTEETIKKISYKMMKDKMIDRVNIEHNSQDVVDDAYLVESWLVEDPETDKSRKYGFNPTKGTWMGMYKIDNQKVWDEYVKTGKVKGFSVEGYFSNYAMSKTVCRKNGQCSCGLSENQNGLCDGSHLKK